MAEVAYSAARANSKSNSFAGTDRDNSENSGGVTTPSPSRLRRAESASNTEIAVDASWGDITGNRGYSDVVEAPEGWSYKTASKEASRIKATTAWRHAGKKVKSAVRIMNAKSASAPAVRVGRKDFFFGKELGSGAFARVVHAKRKITGEEYAVKIMEKAFIKKHRKVKYVMMEKNVLSKLSHPHIVKLYFTFQDKNPGNLYMVVDLCYSELLHYINYCAHEQLSTRKIHDRALSMRNAQFYMAEIIEGLEFLHSRKIIHRDLKPENILLDRDGHIKIADFGTALDKSNRLSSTDDELMFCGTAQFVSPEVLEDRPATEGSDLWAIGCILFQVSH